MLETTFLYKYEDLHIQKNTLSQLMGYKEPESVPEPVDVAIDEIIKTAPSLCNIRGGYVISENITVDTEKKQILSHGQTFLTGKTISLQLRKAEHAAWFTCTAGEELSNYSKKLMKEGDYLTGYVVDVIANVIVDAAMDKIQASLKESLQKDGLKITNRYSPGYCEWNVSDQHKLFKAFPEAYLNISLTPSSLMIPIKSISGIIGIGKEVKYNKYTCDLCKNTNCIYRNKK